MSVEYGLTLTLLAFMLLAAWALARSDDLLAAVMLAGIISLASAAVFTVMDAVDVAFTEAAVGAGVATLLSVRALGVLGERRAAGRARVGLPFLVVLVCGGLLLYGTADLPAYGDPAAPAMQHVAPHYLARGGVETGVPNIVTAVLASYRGFDTFGELVVIFTAGLGVLTLLAGSGVSGARSEVDAGDRDIIVRQVVKWLVPFVLLFALYVQFHGDYGPGGGFQAGVIFAAGMVLYALTFGLPRLERVLPPSRLRLLAATGVWLYGGVGVACLLRGGAFLDYAVLAEDAVDGQHLGILLVELGVGLTVFSVMVLIYRAFTRQRHGGVE
ncbi:MAG: hypothetical protein KatS3mg121_0950 [Gammaproteobacteria bacterium]|nr:MAG: hypothetical protein KatS3mg121_0950 [Gammaproteobacteria bacterium]